MVDSAEKTKKKQMLVAFISTVGVIMLMVFGMWLSDPNRGKPTPMELRQQRAEEVRKDFTGRSSSSVTAEETWIARSEKEITQLRRDNKELQTKLERMIAVMDARQQEAIRRAEAVEGKLEAARNQDSELPLPLVNNTPLPPPPQATPVKVEPEQKEESSLAQTIAEKALPPPPSTRSSSRAVNRTGDGKAVGSIQVVSLTNDDPTQGSADDDVKNASHYLPTGAFATAVLMSGMDAPTGGQAKSNPVPVLLRLMDAGQLPNYWNSDVQNCHVTGAAYGEISSERAQIRLETLSCVLTNGDIIEEKIAGYVSGEDGKAGLRGRLVSKQGAAIAKSLLAGIASGLGESLSSQYSQVQSSALGNVTTVDPENAVEAGLATGTSNALERVADYYIARANEMYPIIEIDANRIGEIILTKGADMKRNIVGNTRSK